MEAFFLDRNSYNKFDLGERLQCSEEDKSSCIDTMNFILEMSSQAKKHGLLHLENYIDKAQPYLLRKAILYVIDGIESDMLIKILTTYMLADNLRGKELLQGILILDGMLCVQAGVNTMELREVLSAYFGIGFQEKLIESFNNKDNDTVQDYIKEHEAALHLDARTAILEEFDEKLDDRSLQRLLREIDMTDIVLGMYGASGKFQKRVLLNVSKKLSQILVDELGCISNSNIDDIVDSQKRMVEIIFKLKEDGDILLKA